MVPETSPIDFSDAGASDDEPVMAHRLGLTQGHLRRWADLIEKLCNGSRDLEIAVYEERERCRNIISAARFGEIDDDFRSLISRIESGDVVEKND
jgi:hypothetical protein